MLMMHDSNDPTDIIWKMLMELDIDRSHQLKTQVGNIYTII